MSSDVVYTEEHSWDHFEAEKQPDGVIAMVRKFDVTFRVQFNPDTEVKSNVLSAALAHTITNIINKHHLMQNHKMRITLYGYADMTDNQMCLYRFMDFNRNPTFTPRSFESFLAVTNYTICKQLKEIGESLMPMANSLIRVRYFHD